MLYVCVYYSPVQATSKQLWTVFNFLVTVIGSFAFGFCAARAVGYELPGVSHCSSFSPVCVLMHGGGKCLFPAVFHTHGIVLYWTPFAAEYFCLQKSGHLANHDTLPIKTRARPQSAIKLNT